MLGIYWVLKYFKLLNWARLNAISLNLLSLWLAKSPVLEGSEQRYNAHLVEMSTRWITQQPTPFGVTPDVPSSSVSLYLYDNLVRLDWIEFPETQILSSETPESVFANPVVACSAPDLINYSHVQYPMILLGLIVGESNNLSDSLVLLPFLRCH